MADTGRVPGRRGRALVRRVYGPRIAGLGLGLLCVAAVFHTVGVAPWLWAGVLFHGLVWPHLAHAWGMRSARPYATARLQLLIDSTLVGVWAAGMQFNALGTAATVALTNMDAVAVGGPRLLLAGLAGGVGSAVLAGAALGFPVRLASTPFEIYAALPLLVLFPLLIGYVCWRLDQRLARSKRELAEQGARDGLTGLYNRAHLERVLRETFEARRDGLPACTLMLMDMDGFKAINDNHGHVAGDAALRHVARCLAASLGPSDLCARYGGDEFVVVVQGDETAGAAIYERLRRRLREAAPATSWLSGVLTLSAGAAACTRDLADSDAWLGRADAALYEAKRGGRDAWVGASTLVQGPGPSLAFEGEG